MIRLKYFTVLFLVLVMVMGSAFAAEIYNKDGNVVGVSGVVSGSRYLSYNVANDGDRSFVLYNVFGKTQINDLFSGFGVWEHEILLQDIEQSDVKNNQIRLGYVGVRYGVLGSIDYGRNYGVLYDVGVLTDVMPEFGGDTFIIDNFLSSRASNVITYRNLGFFGLCDKFDFALQYQGKNKDGYSRSLRESNGDGYGISLSYCFDNDVSFAAAYTNSKRTVAQKYLSEYCNGSNAEAYSVGVRYDNSNLYLAALYGETRNMTPFGDFKNIMDTNRIYGFVDKAENIELVAQYRFDFGLIPSIGYLHTKANDIANGYSCYLKKFFEVGFSYNFNKNMYTSVDYRINLIKQDDFTTAASISTDNIFSLGMYYVF